MTSVPASGPLNVLVVDDDPQLSRLLATWLAKYGHLVETAANGRVALQIAEARHLDAALVDIIMPEMEGLETIIELRRRLPNARIIAMSGGGRVGPEEFLGLARSFGAAGVLKKPFKLQDALEAISGNRIAAAA